MNIVKFNELRTPASFFAWRIAPLFVVGEDARQRRFCGDWASTEQNPAHTFSKPGIYTVCLIASNQYAADTICKQVAAGVSSLPALPMLPQAQVFPNPATDALTVRLPALLPGHPLRFALTDAYRRTVHEAALTDFETTVEVTGLPAGMYFWLLSVRGEVVQAGKVCVHR